jgi:hypothetical protein
MAALENAETHFNAKKKDLEGELALLREQINYLETSLAVKNKELAVYESQRKMKEELIHHIIREDSLVIEEQPRLEMRSPSFHNSQRNINNENR